MIILSKPFDNDEVVRITRRVLAEGQLKRNLKSITDGYRGNFGLIESMGPSDKIGRLVADVHRVAKSDFSVVIMGETGSGKELVARAIHGDSEQEERALYGGGLRCYPRTPVGERTVWS